MANHRYPPNSRLFIIAGKGISKDEYHKCFSKFGSIQDIWIVKDRQTNEEKGVVYIKFNKTSAAFLAMEEMNGKCIPGHPKLLKVSELTTLLSSTETLANQNPLSGIG
uniref:RRM domain-containing protein n=1 Tax=Octopus bimaculoides TaxID=37653 RepID=A0A0L8IF17_OCTBM